MCKDKDSKYVPAGAPIFLAGKIVFVDVVPGTQPGRPTYQVGIEFAGGVRKVSYVHTTDGALEVAKKTFKALGCANMSAQHVRQTLIGKEVNAKVQPQEEKLPDGTRVAGPEDVQIRTSSVEAEEATEALGAL